MDAGVRLDGRAAMIEQELREKGLNGPRVTYADIEGRIVKEVYFTAADGILGSRLGTQNPLNAVGIEHGLITFCVLTLRNNYTVVGQSACASPENFDRDIGQRLAREDAVRNVWSLLAYELRTRLSQGTAASEAGFQD